MAYGSKDERKARMKAAVERQMREHPEWYDGSYNDSPTGGYTQKSVKARGVALLHGCPLFGQPL